MAANFFNNRARAAALAAGNAEKGKDKQVNPSLQPWVEKYRPKTLEDVAAQEHTVAVLQRTLEASNLPHMLFYGPPGTGKTSTILALAKSLFGPALYRSRILELNASDERGIGIVREKVKDFARTQLTHAPSDAKYRAAHPCPPFKIIILDEADSMTQDAQWALRRTMERYSRITRFCLVCNYVTKIVDPVASRCSKFRFKMLDGGSARSRLDAIVDAEKLRVEDGVTDCLIRCSEGDLRRAITYLQSGARLVTPTQQQQQQQQPNKKNDDDDDDDNDDEDITMDDADADADAGTANKKPQTITVRMIEEIAGIVPDTTVDSLVTAVQPTKSSRSTYNPVSAVVANFIADGWSASQVLTQLYHSIIFNESTPDIQKNDILLLFSEMDKRLVDGADEHLTILSLALQISKILKGSA